jgi:multidrug resistance efflux pump
MDRIPKEQLDANIARCQLNVNEVKALIEETRALVEKCRADRDREMRRRAENQRALEQHALMKILRAPSS